MVFPKYPRICHFPFSPGSAGDDRMAVCYDRLLDGEIVITEKLDGENICITETGVYSRSHSTPCRDPWAAYLSDIHQGLKGKLRDLELFGKNLYAVHSIEYSSLPHHFFIFGIRESGRWFAWDEVEFYAGLTGLPLVPVIFRGAVSDLVLQQDASLVLPITNHDKLAAYILEISKSPSCYSDPGLFHSPVEGFVVRVAGEFPDDLFADSIFKWVRPNHVTGEHHWRKNWRRAMLNHELRAMKNNNILL